MFLTQNNAETVFPAENGIRAWWYIQQQIHVHWFHVTYQETYQDNNEELTTRNIIFFSLHEHLIQFANEPDTIIEQVYIITPNYMNSTNQWKMDLLEEIWEAYEPSAHGQIANIFKLTNGERYIASGLDTSYEQLANKQKIFPT